MMLSPDQALILTSGMACLATFVSTLEVLRRPEWLSDTHLLSWAASRLRYRFLSVGPAAGLVDLLLRPAHFRWVLYLRLALAAATPLTSGRLHGALLLTLAVLFALWSLRSPYGQDGSDQMTLLLTLSVALSDLVGTPGARLIAVWFIAAQLALSYFVAGAAKAASPIWRSGEALPLVFRTSIYGHSFIYALVEARPSIAVAGCWAVFCLEIIFPLGLITPPPVALALTAGMAAFHCATALFMGLNTFMLAFLAAYPCWLYVALS